MAGPWEKYANPANRYGADPVKVREQQLKEEANSRANDAADRAADAAARAAANSENANRIAEQKLQADLAKEGLMVGPNGQIVPRPGGSITKSAAQDPQRGAQIQTILQNIDELLEIYCGQSDYQPQHKHPRLQRGLGLYAKGWYSWNS